MDELAWINIWSVFLIYIFFRTIILSRNSTKIEHWRPEIIFISWIRDKVLKRLNK